eukprot:c11112_g1_i1 orf=520-2169(-)
MANFDPVVEFTWGKAKGTSNKGKKYYSSFFYENEEYHLFDNVIVHDKKEPDGHVAKIMKLWEDISNGTMMTLLRWFLKPHELPSHLQSQVLCEGSKELFLAFGKGKGVSNENKLDCIERKCNVICTSKDARNKQPSEENLQAADYFFNRIYNVDLKKLSNVEGIVKILGEDVLFNKQEWVSNEQSGDQNTGSPAVNSFPFATIHVTPAVQQPVEDREVVVPDSGTRTGDPIKYQGELKYGSKADNLTLKRPSLALDKDKPIENRAKLQRSVKQEAVHGFSGMLKASQDVSEWPAQQPFTRSASAKKSELDLPKTKAEGKAANETPNSGRALFADPLLQPGFLIPTRARSKQVQHHDYIVPSKPQDANLEESLLHGRVLLIQNVDASFTSKDMCDLMMCAVEGCSGAQMLQRSGSLSALSGEALLVFETEGLADSALQQFEENCLILSGCRRPLIASKVKISDPGNIQRFPGHFPLDNFKPWKQRQEEVMKKCFETCHFPDPNTVEFEMATEWRSLHAWLGSCWEQLCKIQREEMKVLLEKYKKPKLTVP